jgi:hypothetical protein
LNWEAKLRGVFKEKGRFQRKITSEMYPTFTEQVCKAQKGPTYVGLYNGQSDLSIRLNSDTAKTAQSNPSGVLGKERKFSERKFIKF